MKKTKIKSKYHFYILKCKDKTLYCGIAKDVKKRLEMHNAGLGSKYVRSRGGGKIVFFEQYKTKGKALKREAEVKKWTREKKLALINNS